MKFSHLYTLTFLALFTNISIGQISFTDHTYLLDNADGFTSGNVLGIADMNADGYDDIVRMNTGNMLSIEHQMTDTFAFTNLTHGLVQGDAWAIVLGDINNNGFNDIMAGGSYDGIKVLTSLDNGAFYFSSLFGMNEVFVQGSNMADINNDGFLDIFTCHDDGESRIWANNGQGLFTAADEWIDMTTTPISDNSGNYGSVWTDFDNDGDLDLYIAKCRIGVSDENDPRRINALFVNDGENNYHEAAEEYGLQIKNQSWTADFQDIDNDGDLDCFITNHNTDLQLLENDGTGHFTDISQQAGVAMGNGENFVQGILRDFDNDGWMDIVTAQPTLFFHNNGDQTFTEMDPFGEDFGSLAAGDLNHDGFVDLYTSYQCGFNNPCGIPDKLWINDGNDDNHFLTVNLTGLVTNRMGVGARIEIHGEWGVQIREVRAGESYGISNSLAMHFGLGSATNVDYVVVKWPSGVVDVVEDVSADQFININEANSCQQAGFQLTDEDEIVLCLNETLTLTAPDGYSYLWNNGSTEQTIEVDAPGNYNVVIIDDDGCFSHSNFVKVVIEPDETPTLAAMGETVFCEGGSVVIETSATGDFIWSNGETTPTITVTETGDFHVSVEGTCSDFVSETIHIEVLPQAGLPTADGVTVIAPSTATLEATGSNPYWYETADTVDAIAEGNIFETPELTETTTYYVADANEFGGGDYSVGMEEAQGDTLFNGNNFNGQILFEVYETLLLKEVTVTTDQEGLRIIELRDGNNANMVLQSIPIDLPVGESILDLNMTIEPGNYRLTTNRDNNDSQLGTFSPRLYRSEAGVQYPYEIPGMSITGANFGSGFYYYFFDWQVSVIPVKCFSDRIPVIVNVEPNAVREVAPFGKIAVMPNPSKGNFTMEIQAIEAGRANLSISDITGKQVFADQFEANPNQTELRQIELVDVPSGIYFLKITNGERASWLKLVVE